MAGAGLRGSVQFKKYTRVFLGGAAHFLYILESRTKSKARSVTLPSPPEKVSKVFGGGYAAGFSPESFLCFLGVGIWLLV